MILLTNAQYRQLVRNTCDFGSLTERFHSVTVGTGRYELLYLHARYVAVRATGVRWTDDPANFHVEIDGTQYLYVARLPVLHEIGHRIRFGFCRGAYRSFSHYLNPDLKPLPRIG